jgi:diguanylate cyclase (GGDEF)-like protein/putative nucleotidyltransferase with HDIG domain
VAFQQERLLGGLRDLVAATGEDDCLRRIEEQAAALFPALEAFVRLEPLTGVEPLISADPDERTWELRARGRLLGCLVTAGGGGPAPDEVAPLNAFVEHAALALDNARQLDEHEHRAQRDPLTGLRNYREFHEALAAAVAGPSGVGPSALSVVVLDLDRFKQVNDRGGHAAGDRLLRATAAALTAVCRASDAAFRIGGDEFALILPGATRSQAALVAERAAAAIGRLAGSAGASWGAAALPEDGTSREELIGAADAAMYGHKGQPQVAAVLERGHVRRRLAVASRLATRLTALRDPSAIAAAVVEELHSAFGYYLAVVHRLDSDGVLRVVAGAGPLAESDADFLAWEQPVGSGINGRVARTGETALIHDTRLDPDYLAVDRRNDPGSELTVPILVDTHVWGVLNLEQLATHAFDDDDRLLAEAVVAQTGAALHRCILIEEVESSFSSTLGVLCDAMETRDRYTAHHTDQVASIAVSLARRLGIDHARLRPLRYCALLHDIGKIGVRTELLTKPGLLTPEEYVEVQEHSVIGAALLARIPMLAEIAPLVRAVHEHWDGAGYPYGLAGEAIPIESRIVAVCDAWDAMISDRPYRPARRPADALAELRRAAGSQFDPQIVAAFIAARRPSKRRR